MRSGGGLALGLVLLAIVLGGSAACAPGSAPSPAARSTAPVPAQAEGRSGTGLPSDAGGAARPLAAVPVAAPPARAPLRVVYVARSGSMGPLWIAQEDGIFARHGLDAELRYIASGTLGMQAMLAHEVDIGSIAASSAVGAALNGADAMYFGALQQSFSLWIYSLPEITTAADLRGKRIGFTRRGSTADTALGYYLNLHGLRTDRDLAVAELGESSAALPAMASGAVQAAIFSDPASFLARRQGYRELADLGQLGVEYPQSALVTTRSFAAEHRGLVERFLRAVVEATHRYKTDRDLSLRVLAKYLDLDDPAMVGEIYDLYAGRLVQNVPRATYEGTRTLLEELATQYDQARGADPARFLDLSFLEGLDREGLEARLWGR
jgi:NitT/TauT family transport system substrate-binding protein